MFQSSRQLRSEVRPIAILALLAGAAFAVVVGVFATYGEAAVRPAQVLAVVPTAAGPRLQPLDARTLAPVRGGWSRLVKKDGPAALSPSGLRVAVTGRGGSLLVLNSATGRILRRHPGGPSEFLYWLGGDGTPGSPDPLIIEGDFGCASLGCGLEPFVIGKPDSGQVTFVGMPSAALTEGLVFATEPSGVYVYDGGGGIWVALRRMPTAAPFRVVADVAHDRLFVISSAGLVAEVDHVARRPAVSYHRVDLNGRPFKAAWAGGNRIALWGESGLGTINVGNRTTHHIAPAVTGTVATKFGLAAWTSNPADGVTLYRPDGRMMWRLLEGKAVRSAVTVGDYLYVDADARYSVNLQTGAVFGPVASDVTIVTPDLPRIRQ